MIFFSLQLITKAKTRKVVLIEKFISKYITSVLTFCIVQIRPRDSLDSSKYILRTFNFKSGQRLSVCQLRVRTLVNQISTHSFSQTSKDTPPSPALPSLIVTASQGPFSFSLFYDIVNLPSK